MEEVILVNENDQAIGTMEKMEAHQKGLLHRAFSVFIYNEAGQMLLQQRALGKYHSPGLWTNACCSHPRPGETLENAALRRLKEEMGIACVLQESFQFVYRIDFDNGLTEHELDHVFTGQFSGEPAINTAEVAHWKYMAIEDIVKDMALNEKNYTYWFKLVMQQKYPALFGLTSHNAD